MLSKAKFKAEVSAVCQQMGKVFYDGAVKRQPVFPAVQRKGRLVFLYGRLQPRHFFARHIRWIADQRVKCADKTRSSLPCIQPDRCHTVHKLQPLDVALGNRQRGARDICKCHMGIRQLVCNGEADTAAATAKIQYTRFCSAAQDIERKISNRHGVIARDEHIRRDLQ